MLTIIFGFLPFILSLFIWLLQYGILSAIILGVYIIVIIPKIKNRFNHLNIFQRIFFSLFPLCLPLITYLNTTKKELSSDASTQALEQVQISVQYWTPISLSFITALVVATIVFMRLRK